MPAGSEAEGGPELALAVADNNPAQAGVVGATEPEEPAPEKEQYPGENQNKPPHVEVDPGFVRQPVIVQSQGDRDHEEPHAPHDHAGALDKIKQSPDAADLGPAELDGHVGGDGLALLVEEKPAAAQGAVKEHQDVTGALDPEKSPEGERPVEPADGPFHQERREKPHDQLRQENSDQRRPKVGLAAGGEEFWPVLVVEVVVEDADADQDRDRLFDPGWNPGWLNRDRIPHRGFPFGMYFFSAPPDCGRLEEKNFLPATIPRKY